MKRIFFFLLFLIFFSFNVSALIENGDSLPEFNYKMHFPQYPDPNGWDVSASGPFTLADDWMCTETGPITDIHLWGSWFNDQPGEINMIHLSIHEDIPDPDGPGPLFSKPGNILWECYLNSGQFEIIPQGESPQGWLEPFGQFMPENHLLYHRIDITDMQYCPTFIQQNGTIYWLDAAVFTEAGLWGWKTSLDHFNDDAVYFVDGIYQELRDPITNESLDLAFVITKEIGDECDENIPPIMNFIHPDYGFTVTNPLTINWSWSDSDHYPSRSLVYLFYSTDGGIDWNHIATVDANDGLPSKGKGQYIWDTTELFELDPLPEEVRILGIIFDGCDVGLSDPASGATQAEQEDPSDPYDIVYGQGFVPEFTSIGIVAIIVIAILVIIFHPTKKK